MGRNIELQPRLAEELLWPGLQAAADRAHSFVEARPTATAGELADVLDELADEHEPIQSNGFCRHCDGPILNQNGGPWFHWTNNGVYRGCRSASLNPETGGHDESLDHRWKAELKK